MPLFLKPVHIFKSKRNIRYLHCTGYFKIHKELQIYIIFFFKKNSNIFCKELVFTASHPKRNKEKNNGPLQKYQTGQAYL